MSWNGLLRFLRCQNKSCNSYPWPFQLCNIFLFCLCIFTAFTGAHQIMLVTPTFFAIFSCCFFILVSKKLMYILDSHFGSTFCCGCSQFMYLTKVSCTNFPRMHWKHYIKLEFLIVFCGHDVVVIPDNTHQLCNLFLILNKVTLYSGFILLVTLL